MNLPSDDAPTTSARVTAIDRVQNRENETEPYRWGRASILLVLVGVGLWLAFSWIRGDQPAEESDLLLRMSIAAADFQAATRVSDGDEASAWVFDQYGWPIVIPDLPDLQLIGAGETSLSKSANGQADDAAWVTPTFQYVGTGQENVVLFAYDYAQLDRASEWLMLPQGVYARLAEETPFDTRRLDATGDYAVTWRRRAVVYTAITSSEEVIERLTEALSVPVRP